MDLVSNEPNGIKAGASIKERIGETETFIPLHFFIFVKYIEYLFFSYYYLYINFH